MAYAQSGTVAADGGSADAASSIRPEMPTASSVRMRCPSTTAIVFACLGRRAVQSEKAAVHRLGDAHENYQPVYGLLPDVERSVVTVFPIGSGAVVYPACLWRR